MAQRAGVKGLGQVQTGLKEETGELIEKLDGAPVFALTLRRASQNMEIVAKRLQETKTDKSTEEAARSRLRPIQTAPRIAQGRCRG